MLTDNLYKGSSSTKRHLQLRVEVKDDKLFFLSLRAGKSGWFCGNMGAEERVYKKVFLNWMSVKAVSPDDPTQFKVVVHLGIVVHNVEEELKCPMPLFSHKPII